MVATFLLIPVMFSCTSRITTPTLYCRPGSQSCSRVKKVHVAAIHHVKTAERDRKSKWYSSTVSDLHASQKPFLP